MLEEIFLKRYNYHIQNLLPTVNNWQSKIISLLIHKIQNMLK